MSSRILNEITGSPNSVKVRIALGYKGLEYERRPFEPDQYPGNREAIVKISRQPRYPVLQDGPTIIFDSAAILRYLEANYPDAPPIFVGDYAAHSEIEQWELYAKMEIGKPVSRLFGEVFAPAPNPDVIAEVNRQLVEGTGRLEDRLGHAEFLVADHLTAADIVCAASLYLADISEELAATHPIAAFFRKNLDLGRDREKTRSWVRRVMAHDAVLGRRG